LDLLTPQFEALISLYEQGKIHPRINKTFSFADAPAAHHYHPPRTSLSRRYASRGTSSLTLWCSIGSMGTTA
jgi:hypothetical protein